MDLRMMGLSSAFAFFHSAFSASILAAAASISPFKSASCFSVLRSKASLGNSGERFTSPEGGGRPPEKKRAPRDEEGEDEDSEWRRKVDGAKRCDDSMLRPLPTTAWRDAICCIAHRNRARDAIRLTGTGTIVGCRL